VLVTDVIEAAAACDSCRNLHAPALLTPKPTPRRRRPTAPLPEELGGPPPQGFSPPPKPESEGEPQSDGDDGG
jgi:hypothetical protein